VSDNGKDWHQRAAKLERQEDSMKVAAFTLISLSIVLGLVDPRQAFDGNQQSYGTSSARAGRDG